MKLLTLAITFFCINQALAQHSFRAQIKDYETRDPLPGASISIPSLGIGDISDESGMVQIDNIPDGTYLFEIRFLGYQPIQIKRSIPLEAGSAPEIFFLKHTDEELEELVVQSNRSSRVIEDVPTRVEIIAGEELSEKGNMKPGDIRMLLNESTGIQTQQTSATSYNSSIRIQGLDGKYTQLLRDGLPLYSGYSGGLSLMQIAPLDLAQVEVIKGSASTLYGGGAIAGLVNLISKTPGESPELSLMLNGTSALGLDASAFYSAKGEKFGTTIFTSYNKGTAYDPADIGLTAIPKFDRFTLNPKLFWEVNEQSEIVAGLNLMTEKRLGGNVDFIQGESVANPYFEKNQTERISTELKYFNQFADNSGLTFKNTFSFYDRSIFIPDYQFSGRQMLSFSEINLSTANSKTEWITGLNLWTDRFTQQQGNLNQQLDYTLNTVGVFVQNIWNTSEKWTIESGLRLDYQKDYGIFPLPKISFMYEPSNAWTFRLGGGLGYKSPTVFTEDAERLQFRNILPINPRELEAERSGGANFDINYKVSLGEELSLVMNSLLFYTRIQDPLLLVRNGAVFEFQQNGGYFRTQGLELNLKWNYKDLKLFTGYTFADVIQSFQNQSSPYPLVAKHRLNNVLMYEKHDNFWIGLEAYYYSPQLLNDGETGESFWIMGLMTEKKLGESFSLFLNFENFLDTRQTRFDTIFTGNISDPQFRDIYAPVDGFVINGGFKLSL
ncbi:TonB-dependent receptor [Algoriphagus algorifonticola]|uniref:TonB-dependent receptor n=1 Tax=Algoriphagus algorifonticola TaxID=2593007 RepID=UPI00119CFEC9|nr:TonB-dependent receptor [Algoriphagus algorifonticola]